MQLRNRHFRRDPLIFKEGLVADATAEQRFLKRPLHFFLEYDHQKVDATAQQAVSEGASENLRRVGSCCNSGTDVFEKTPFYFFGRRVFQKWMQLRNRHFRRDPLLFKEGLEADATAEQIFLKRPPQFFLEE